MAHGAGDRPHGLKHDKSLYFAPSEKKHMDFHVGQTSDGNQTPGNADSDKWIQGAIKHPGRCTPMSKPGCTGAARRLAERFKRGDIHKANLKKGEER